MPVIQQAEKYSFGTGRAFVQPLGSTTQYTYGDLNDIAFDIKYNQKEIFSENGFPIAVFDGHKSISIGIKHYRLDLSSLSQDLNLNAPGASTQSWIQDEAGAVASATPFTYTLSKGASYVANSISLRVFLAGTGGVTYPVTYKIVAAGSEVAGSAASISAAGVITFAAGDAGLAVQATYAYTTTVGTQITITNQYQNSAPSYAFTFIKRDRSPIDNSVGMTVIKFNAVRFGGIKWGYSEGKEVEADRQLMAFSDPSGNVGTIQFINQ